jgi:hypothetical protein
MFKFLLATCALGAISQAASGADLTALEQRWLGAASPVLAYARSVPLPIDIIVQPRTGPNDVPMAMGFDGGRCKLVLSLRGNPQAESVLNGIAPEAQGELIEAMAAHEIAHCRRYAQGAWHALPAGFVDAGDETAADPALLAVSKAMRETRREEGYADLVALAWTWRRHPADYGRIYTWLDRVRHDQPVARNSHDTLAWIRLARDTARFGKDEHPFDDVLPLWQEGLVTTD